MKKIFSVLLLCFITCVLKAQIIPEGTYCIKYAYNQNFCMDLSENGKSKWSKYSIVDLLGRKRPKMDCYS